MFSVQVYKSSQYMVLSTLSQQQLCHDFHLVLFQMFRVSVSVSIKLLSLLPSISVWVQLTLKLISYGKVCLFDLWYVHSGPVTDAPFTTFKCMGEVEICYVKYAHYAQQAVYYVQVLLIKNNAEWEVRQIILLYGVEIWATYTYLHILNVRWSATVLQAKKLGWRPGKETIMTMTSSYGGSKIITIALYLHIFKITCYSGSRSDVGGKKMTRKRIQYTGGA